MHDALIYATDAELTDALVPFVRDGLAAGEPVVAVVPPASADLLRAALGTDGDAVAYVDADSWYARPAQTIQAYAHVLDDHIDSGARQVRVIGEVRFGETTGSHVDWTRYEAALNHVFATSPAWIVCPYDERVLPWSVVSDARRTHSRVVERGRWADSPYYLPPEQLMRWLAAPEPEPGRCLLRVGVDADSGFAQARQLLAAVAAASGLDRARVEDLVTAANEVITNGVRHGAGGVELVVSVCGPDLVCEVVDQGAGIPDELAGYVPLDRRNEPVDGMGLWLARYLCDRLELRREPRGFVVRLIMADVFA
jgi:anti-sigma regulatory factor (Ser/Thr protein kinase)